MYAMAGLMTAAAAAHYVVGPVAEKHFEALPDLKPKADLVEDKDEPFPSDGTKSK
eukprot:SAG11_NODE_5328_length_1594_cov_2.320401_1_plen_55_part_00